MNAPTFPHWTDESDVSLLTVENVPVRGNPQAGHLGQYVDDLEQEQSHQQSSYIVENACQKKNVSNPP